MAPEHPFLRPFDDVFAAYGWLLDQGMDPAPIVFAGESAGGAMVVSIMVKARDAGWPLPTAGLAISDRENWSSRRRPSLSDGVLQSLSEAATHRPAMLKAGFNLS